MNTVSSYNGMIILVFCDQNLPKELSVLFYNRKGKSKCLESTHASPSQLANLNWPPRSRKRTNTCASEGSPFKRIHTKRPAVCRQFLVCHDGSILLQNYPHRLLQVLAWLLQQCGTRILFFLHILFLPALNTPTLLFLFKTWNNTSWKGSLEVTWSNSSTHMHNVNLGQVDQGLIQLSSEG